MRRSMLGLLAGLCLSMAAPVGAQTQVELASPADGGFRSTAPWFSWSGAPYDRFLFLSLFHYEIGAWSGYVPIAFWIPDTGFAMPPAWWDLLSAGTEDYWLVLGVDTLTRDWSVSPVGTFTKRTDLVALGSPADGEIVDNGGQFLCSDPFIWDFAWGTVPGFSDYRLFVQYGSPGAPPAIDTVVSGTTYRKVGGTASNDYPWRWKVQPYPGGEWSEERVFYPEPVDADCP